MEENHMYSDVIGSGAMPYLSSLASKYGLATQYYADTHPSIGNYFMLTTGSVLTNDDTVCNSQFVTGDNIVSHLMTAGKTWKSYAESMPSPTSCNSGPYLVRHNPFAYFKDVTTSSEVANLVPFTQFATDLASNQLPNFSFIVPNADDDAHNGTLGQADNFLLTNIAPLLASPAFQAGGDGILMIVFDEAETSDAQHGGGHVAAVVIGPKVKPGYQSTTLYQHESTLKTILEALGANPSLGNAATAPDMKEFFQ
jgi:acid phosphatase